MRSSCSNSLPRCATRATRATEDRRIFVSAAIRSARSRKTRPGRCSVPGSGGRLACPSQGLDRDLKFLDIGGLTIVQDDEIDGELFHAPIFVRLQKLSHDVDVFDVRDAQKNDRQIPGNALRPQTRLRAAATHNRIRRGTHGRRGVNHMSGESLKQARFARGHAKMVQLHLTLRPRQRRGARKRGRVAMFVDAVEKRFAAWRRRSSSRRHEQSRPAQRECAGGWRKSDRGQRRSSSRAADYP